MLPVSHPDMLPTQPEPEVSGAGPDILSNGIHGERDRPDILAPASEPEISASLYSAPDGKSKEHEAKYDSLISSNIVW